MNIYRTAALIVAGVALAPTMPVLAQAVTQTKVDTDTKVKGGVATTKTTVTHSSKRKTRQPRKILGVKVGHKTAVSKTVKTTSVSSNGDSSTTVKSR